MKYIVKASGRFPATAVFRFSSGKAARSFSLICTSKVITFHRFSFSKHFLLKSFSELLCRLPAHFPRLSNPLFGDIEGEAEFTASLGNMALWLRLILKVSFSIWSCLKIVVYFKITFDAFMCPLCSIYIMGYIESSVAISLSIAGVLRGWVT